MEKNGRTVMLYLVRKEGEEVIIDGDIVIKVLSVGKSRVKLGFQAPREISVFRAELVDEAERD